MVPLVLEEYRAWTKNEKKKTLKYYSNNFDQTWFLQHSHAKNEGTFPTVPRTMKKFFRLMGKLELNIA